MSQEKECKHMLSLEVEHYEIKTSYMQLWIKQRENWKEYFLYISRIMDQRKLGFSSPCMLRSSKLWGINQQRLKVIYKDKKYGEPVRMMSHQRLCICFVV